VQSVPIHEEFESFTLIRFSYSEAFLSLDMKRISNVSSGFQYTV